MTATRASSILRVAGDPRLLFIALVLAMAGFALLVSRGGGDGHSGWIEPPGLSVSPSGEGVSRLAPIRVTFPSPPGEREGARLVSLSPAVEGTYHWVSERTLLFQPSFPGMLRGHEYSIAVRAAEGAGLDADVLRTFVTDGVLTVQTVIPGPGDFDVPANAEVYVQFSRSVAPLTLLSERDARPVIAFDPPIAGTGEWLNTSLYRFTPASFAPNTSYTLRIAAGLTSAADGVLKEDYTWTFTTYGPAVNTLTPEDNTRFASPTQEVVVTFNQPMDRSSVEAAFKLTAADSTAPIGGTFSWSEDDTRVVYSPAGRLAADTTYRVDVPAGLAGRGGGQTKTARAATFRTIPAPAVIATMPADGATAAERYGIQITFAGPMDTDSFEGRVSVSGVSPGDVFIYPEQGQYLYLSVPLRPSTFYRVDIAAGARDRYGQPLGPFSFSFTTGALQPAVTLALPNEVATFSASQEPILYFHATNVERPGFILWPLTPDEARGILLRGSIDVPPSGFFPSLPSLRSWSETVSGSTNQVVLGSTSVTGGGPLPKGHYLVRTTGGSRSQVMFTVVDSVLIGKTSQDELLVWALDHDSGRPLGGVTLQSGSSRSMTDGQGLARFPLPAAQESGDKYCFTCALVTLDDGLHFGVLSTSWQQGISPYLLNVPLEWGVREYVGQVYTDRPIYRPGETVYYKGIVRLDDDAAYAVPMSAENLDFVLRDPQGAELRRETLQLNAFGSFAGSFELPSGALIGDYSLTVERQGTEPYYAFRIIAANSFAAAEFRKPEFQVEVTPGSPRYVSGETARATVDASFFFGGAVAGAPVEWTVLASPLFFRPPGYEGYSFSDYDYWYARTAVSQSPTRARGTGVTDAGGQAEFTFPAALLGNEGAQAFQVIAVVTDQNAQAIADAVSVEVHPGSYYAGIRTRSYMAEAGEQVLIDLVKVETSGTAVAAPGGVLNVYERKWITTKEMTPEGARRYRSEPQDTLLEAIPLPAGSGPELTVSFTPPASGTYRLVSEMADERGRVARAATYVWVWGGESYAPWRVSNDDTLELVADKTSYEVGETARILVPAPFQGAVGLITIERGKIISRETRAFASNAETISVPIVDRHVPNAYVSVVLYRPPTADDPVPRYKVGYVKLTVSTASRVLHVDIRPDREQAKPGDLVTYDIRVTDEAGHGVRAELSAAVVDKAVLSLADDRGPNGLAAFWFERGLGVVTSASLAVSINRANDVISEPSGGGKGGGGFEEDRLRQEFRNTAYWEAQLVTDASGNARVQVRMPDNLTTWRMQVRAISGDTLVGEATNELLSTQPLLLRPALPRFLRVGDHAVLRLLVRNATAAATEVQVELGAEGLELVGGTSRSATVPAQSSVVMEWPANAVAEGTAGLVFTASAANGQRDAIAQAFPVWLDVTPETMATGGIVAGEPMFEAVYLPDYAILAGGSLEVSVQPSLAGSLAAELYELRRELVTWGDEGSERIASRLMATAGVVRANRSARLSTRPLEDQMDTDLAALVARQRADGGWPWCSLCPHSDPAVSGWVLMAIGEAVKEGRTVDWNVLNRASTYVFAYSDRPTDVLTPADPNQRAFLLYALARAGGTATAVPAARATFEQQRTRLNNMGRAYLVLALTEGGAGRSDGHVSALLNDLYAATIPSANGNHWEDARTSGSIHTNTAVTALVLQALVRASPGEPMVAQTVRWLVVARGAGQWQTTIERAMAILALSEFGVQTGELGGSYAFRVGLDDDTVFEGRFTGTDATARTTRIALSRIGAGKQSLLSFLRDGGSGRLYYALNLRYLTPAREVEALNRGFAVSHEYSRLDAPGTRIDRIELGQAVRVKVTVVVPADRNYVVINDYLPAGLEAVDTRLNVTDPALIEQLERERRSAAGISDGAGYFAPWWHWYYSPWQHVEIRDDRVTLTAQQLAKGVYEYIYYARATSPGDFFVAPAHAEETYFPETFGRSDSSRFLVER
jgi:uncharacterized protein YfaS (alpha-2-macroglobulin family)